MTGESVLKGMSMLNVEVRLEKFFKNHPFALASMAQWLEHWPVNHRVAGSIPSQGTCLGCGPGLQ